MLSSRTIPWLCRAVQGLRCVVQDFTFQRALGIQSRCHLQRGRVPVGSVSLWEACPCGKRGGAGGSGLGIVLAQGVGSVVQERRGLGGGGTFALRGGGTGALLGSTSLQGRDRGHSMVTPGRATASPPGARAHQASWTLSGQGPFSQSEDFCTSLYLLPYRNEVISIPAHQHL